MTAITFDTLKYVKKLEVAGIPRPQAEAQAEATSEVFSEIIEESLATKHDLNLLKVELEAKIETKVESAKSELLKWYIGVGLFQAVTMIGAIVALVNFLK